MPYSSKKHDDTIRDILKRIEPVEVWDIGAGAGKYGKMLRALFPAVQTTAVEMDADYIARFDLEKTYARVLRMRAEALVSPEFYDQNFDTVIIGDCIEHLKKSDGVDLLNFLVYRARWILVIYPEKFLQNSVAGKPQEAHIAVWGDADFAGFTVAEKGRSGYLVYVLLQGYLGEAGRVSPPQAPNRG